MLETTWFLAGQKLGAFALPTKPEVPVRGYSFSDFQALNPTVPLPGVNVDIEFDRGYETDHDFLDWLSVSIADDGTIKRESLGDITGEAGPQGPQGIQGPAGVHGADGAPGPQGNPGPQGQQGPIGPSGQSYVPNATGLAASRPTYDSQPPGFSFLATDTGSISFRTTATAGTWSSWFAFTKGDVGPQGVQGPAGPQGSQGVDGTDGVNGLNGAAGPQGVQGVQGPAGTNGFIGWTPLMAAETYNDKRLIKVTDYINGTGTKPTTLGYLSATGLTGNKDLAIDFRQVALTVYNTQQFGPTTAGATTFTIDGGYLVGTLRIFKQGLRQRIPEDVVASNGVTIVFAVPFVGGEYVIVEEMAPFEIASTLSKPLNLSDVPDKAAARINLGIPGAAGGGSTSVAGLIRLATDAEAQAKTANTIALTPNNLAALQGSTTFTGLLRLATQAEAIVEGTTTLAMSPNDVAHYVNTNLASWKDRALFVSGAGPSGGKDGDIWMQII